MDGNVQDDRAMLVAHRPESFAPANGMVLCYDCFGDPSAPPILLIMGLAAQMVMWEDAFCAQLASRGFWVIRFDNRDAGRSTILHRHPPPSLGDMMMAPLLGMRLNAPYTLRDMGRDVTGLMDWLRIKSAHLVGASMGGAIAQEIAIHDPARVRTLTLVMSNSGEQGHAPTREAMSVLTAPIPATWPDYLASFRNTWAVLRGPGFPEDEARDAELARRTFARGVYRAAPGRQLAAVIASGNRTAALRRVKAPALVMHGEADPLVPVQAGRALARAIPGAELMVIQRMGHALPVSLWPQIIGAIARHAGRHN